MDVQNHINQGTKPNFIYNTGLGTHLKDENLIYIFSQVLNSYKTFEVLPEFITVNPWIEVQKNSTIFVSMSDISNAANILQSYIETTHKLPDSLTIPGTAINMPQTLNLLTKTIINIDNKIFQSIILEKYGPPSKPHETVISGFIPKDQYIKMANDVIKGMDMDRAAVNYVKTQLNDELGYPSLIYHYSLIINSIVHTNKLPHSISIIPWNSVSNPETVFLSMDQVITSAESYKKYVETEHKRPDTLNIDGTPVSINDFMRLEFMALNHLTGSTAGPIIQINIKKLETDGKIETIRNGPINKEKYLEIAKTIVFNAPIGARIVIETELGNIGIPNLLYIGSQILTSYKEKETLPDFITITPWKTINDYNTTFFSVEQVITASNGVQKYIEVEHKLPDNIKVNDIPINTAQFLKLEVETLLNIKGNLNTTLSLEKYPIQGESIDDIQRGNINETVYLKMAGDIKNYFDRESKAPVWMSEPTSGSNIGFENLIYTYTKILNSYQNTNQTLPDFITITPWKTINDHNTIFFSVEQIKNAAESVQSYITSKHALPNNTYVDGKQVSMPELLNIFVELIINLDSDLYTTIIWKPIQSPINSIHENMSMGHFINDEIADIATKAKSYIDNTGKAPSSISGTSLGDEISYESLIYIFSKFLRNYNVTDAIHDSTLFFPYLVWSNPEQTYNFRTQKMFRSIQEAINAEDTLNEDTIWLGKKDYYENIIINKKVIIKPLEDLNVTIHAYNTNLPVFTINSNGSTIRDLNLTGSKNNACILVSNSKGNQIIGNTIQGNKEGIIIQNSNKTFISGNTIKYNSLNGIKISNSLNSKPTGHNTISGNNITDNGFKGNLFSPESAGIYINNSNNDNIQSNIISSNKNGLYLVNASSKAQFNSFNMNTYIGLYLEGNNTVNASNNWWGSNTPQVINVFKIIAKRSFWGSEDSNSIESADIYTGNSIVQYEPWLILNPSISVDHSNSTGKYYNYMVTGDLRYDNQGKDTSIDGTVIDGIPIKFSTNLGTIPLTGVTENGQATVKLSNTTSGEAQILLNLDNQINPLKINITSVNKLGVYNTRSNKCYKSIQDAVSATETISGDTLVLNGGIYTENIVMNKKLTIKPKGNEIVTIKGADPDKSVFIINHGGSGSIIQELNIIGSSSSNGIVLSHTYQCNVTKNNITGSYAGVILYKSGNNFITENKISNGYYGLHSFKSLNNVISGNIISKMQEGLQITASNFNKITENEVTDNYFGTYIIHSHNINISKNEFKDNWAGIYLLHTNNVNIIGNTVKDNSIGVKYHNSMGIHQTSNFFSGNEFGDDSVVDDGEMVMATTIYTCGPAALATILRELGVYTNEGELSKVAGTDESGTSLYGLKKAARSKGFIAVGAKLTIEQLKHNYIAVLDIENVKHFVIIGNVTNESVQIFDPNLGVMKLPLNKFNQFYTGICLVINETLPKETVLLSDEEMKTIKAKLHLEKVMHVWWTPGYYYPTVKWMTKHYSYPVIRFRWVPGPRLWGWLQLPGRFQLYVTWKRASFRYRKVVWRYHPPQKHTYYTTKIMRNSKNKIQVYYAYNFNLDRARKKLKYGGYKMLKTGSKMVEGGFSTKGVFSYNNWKDFIEGGEEYLQHLDEIGTGEDYLQSKPLFEI